jgi:hypothetical protein
MARQVGRRSCGAKAAVGFDELGRDVVQPGTTSSLYPYGGLSGIEPARSRVRAEEFCQWPARLDSAGMRACKATGHAQAG